MCLPNLTTLPLSYCCYIVLLPDAVLPGSKETIFKSRALWCPDIHFCFNCLMIEGWYSVKSSIIPAINMSSLSSDIYCPYRVSGLVISTPPKIARICKELTFLISSFCPRCNLFHYTNLLLVKKENCGQ